MAEEIHIVIYSHSHVIIPLSTIARVAVFFTHTHVLWLFPDLRVPVNWDYASTCIDQKAIRAQNDQKLKMIGRLQNDGKLKSDQKTRKRSETRCQN